MSKHVTALSPEQPSEQPLQRNGIGSCHVEHMTRQPAPYRHFFERPKVAYPDTEEEMDAVLLALGIEPNPNYDGNFFAQMTASDWTIQGEPIWDWPAAYVARLELTQPH